MWGEYFLPSMRSPFMVIAQANDKYLTNIVLKDSVTIAGNVNKAIAISSRRGNETYLAKYVNGRQVKLSSGVTVTRRWNRFTLTFPGSEQVVTDGRWTAAVKLPASYCNYVEGLCGRFSPPSFGDVWTNSSGGRVDLSSESEMRRWGGGMVPRGVSSGQSRRHGTETTMPRSPQIPGRAREDSVTGHSTWAVRDG